MIVYFQQAPHEAHCGADRQGTQRLHVEVGPPHLEVLPQGIPDLREDASIRQRHHYAPGTGQKPWAEAKNA